MTTARSCLAIPKNWVACNPYNLTMLDWYLILLNYSFMNFDFHLLLSFLRCPRCIFIFLQHWKFHSLSLIHFRLVMQASFPFILPLHDTSSVYHHRHLSSHLFSSLYTHIHPHIYSTSACAFYLHTNIEYHFKHRYHLIITM